jgi:hypothetical protein
MRFLERGRLIRLSLQAGALLGVDVPEATAQEMGRIETFGENGRMYAPDRYLISRQSYGSEDSTGYEGKFRVVKRYDGGGYEVETFDYIARCRSVDAENSITTFPQGDHQKILASVSIDRQKRPPASLRNAFNLFWAVCDGQFQKFK